MTDIIAVDFDGTIVRHEYPEIGEDVPGAFEWMKMFAAQGAKLILLTMRSGEHLDAAVDHCKQRGVEFWGVNTNPEQHAWTQSPKVYAHVYVDDAAAGCPLFVPSEGRPYVHWSKVGPIVMDKMRWDVIAS